MTITWHTVRELDAFRGAAPRGQPWCKVLFADLRDPRLVPLLAPPPLALDCRDEARPATNDRAYFLARRAVHRSLIGAIAGMPADEVVIAYDGDGAPRVESPENFCVSVSGHGPYAILAVGNCRMGVDFEPLDESVEPVTDVLHPEERAILKDLVPDKKTAYFLRVWTAKEAYLKAMGRGFLDDPALVRTRFADNEIAIACAERLLAGVSGQLVETVIDGTKIIAACVTITSLAMS